MKSPYYAFFSYISTAGLHFRFDPPATFNEICIDVRESKPFPEGYECREPVFISSPKPRFYEVNNDIIVCQRVADLLEKECGNTIRLMPIHYTPDPQGKYPATDKYYFLWTPMLDCLELVYGDPLPTSKFRQEDAARYGEIMPETERPLLDIRLKTDMVADYPMFRIGGVAARPVLITHQLMKICKSAKIYRIDYTPYRKEFELIRRTINSSKGLNYLLYNLPPICGWSAFPPPEISREFLESIRPKD